MPSEYLVDLDLDWFVWPPAPDAWPFRRGLWPRQLRGPLAPADLAAALAARGYAGGKDHVVAGHQEAFTVWRQLPPARRTVVHIDAHHDLVGARGGLFTFDRTTGQELMGPANFLRIAAWQGLCSRVIWVVPDRLWRNVNRLAFEIDAFCELDPEAGDDGLVCRLPGSVPVEVMPLRFLPPADGPVVARTLALSPEWIDQRLYPRLARQALSALAAGDSTGTRTLRRTLRWPAANERRPPRGAYLTQ